MAYQYDVFLSYTRRASAGEWVERHFYPLLRDALENSMPREVRIFVDWRQETGISWPDNLAQALSTSRVMVAVLSPPYFRSPWCLAEWVSMCERHRVLGLALESDPTALIHPVVFADGDYFPREAKALQYRDFRPWSYPSEVFKNSPLYLDFYSAVQQFAETLALGIEAVPDWRPGWPVIRPDSLPEYPSTNVPRL